MSIETKILSSSEEDIDTAAEILKNGGVVGIPTETVYGLAADALDPNAVLKIFAAKGRPADNPLIVHIGEFEDIYKYVTSVPDNALRLAEAFWPGPLTMVLTKKDVIPTETSGGLDTVGIRFPVNPVARAIINRCGRPLAAPSANLSGSPSPTEFRHVYDDMNGRVEAIVDGGSCAVGVESTVVSFDNDGRVCLLRPGFVSAEDMASVVGAENVYLAKGVTESIGEGEKVRSPGMKYKHYAPNANVTIIDSGLPAFEKYVSDHTGDKVCAVVFDGDDIKLPCPVLTYGEDSKEQANRLFTVLRELDEKGFAQVYFRCPEKTGVGLAVYNRLLRSAGFEVIRL